MMVNANPQMKELEEIAKTCQTKSPHTGQLHKWSVVLPSHARINQVPKAKAQPKPSNPIYCSGVQLQCEKVMEDHDQRSIHQSGSPSWTPASTAQEVQQRAQGSQQVALLEESTCWLNETTWHMVLSSWMEHECIVQHMEQPLTSTIGCMLVNGQLQDCKKFLMLIVAKAAAEKELPKGFRLVHATSTFALPYHLQPGDVQDPHVQQQLSWAA